MHTFSNNRGNSSVVIAVLVGAILIAIAAYYGLQTQPVPTDPPGTEIPEHPEDIAGTTTSEITEQFADQSKMQQFESIDELSAYLANLESYDYGYRNSGFGGFAMNEMMDVDFAMEESIASPVPMMADSKLLAMPPETGGGGDDYSQTNIQVAGVDEADIIKTDGEFIYAVTKKDLYIIKAYPGEDAEILTKIAFKSTPQGLYLAGERLVVYGRNEVVHEDDVYAPFRRYGEFSFVKVFDISDPNNPQQVRDLDFEGSYNNSRMIGDHMYLITQTPSYALYDDPYPLPHILEGGEEIIDIDANCSRCPDMYYIDMPYDSHNIINVASIDIQSDADVESEIYLLNSSQSLYVSPENIYITYTRYIPEDMLLMQVMRDVLVPLLPSEHQSKVASIEAVDDFILSEQEKLRKIEMVIERYVNSLKFDEQSELEETFEKAVADAYEDFAQELEKTIVHKIAIDDGTLKYLSHGEVPGTVLNQFSMDEHEGYFRIATTKNQQWSQWIPDKERESYNNLYVLDKDLNIVGEVEKLARGERIFSVRFMQGRAYMVTFRQTDPLYAIDLTDPENPTVLGELKIPGFSNYLHPYDETRLIGFGRDADPETGWSQGLKLSLFDVRDVENIKEIDTYVWGDSGTNSIALQDHHAFLFSKEKNLLVLPVEMMERSVFDESRPGDSWDGPTDDWIDFDAGMPFPDPVPLEPVEALPVSEEEILELEPEALRIAPSPQPWPMPVPEIEPPRQPRFFRGAYVFNIDEDGFELIDRISHADESEDPYSEYDYWYGYSYYDSTVKRSLYIEELLYTFSNNYLMMHALDSIEEVQRIRLKKTSKDDDFEVIR